MLLVGSQALQERYPKLLRRPPRDLDVVATMPQFEKMCSGKQLDSVYPSMGDKKMIAMYKGRPVEAEIAWTGTLAAELLELVRTDPETTTAWGDVLLQNEPAVMQRIDIPSLNVLYTLKRSHRYLKNSPHFNKTRLDLKAMEAEGAHIPDRYQDWFKRREKETYNYKHPSLMRSKGDFFKGDGVQYVYDHDSIHKVVALHGGVPAYTLYQKDGAEVACDKTKWDELPTAMKLSGVIEEAYVLALERSQIPFKGQLTPKQSFDIALMKVCTSITSGWFRAYAYDNYDAVQAMYNPDYVEKFWKAVELGLVPPHKETT